jgi:putative ABC transport system permease protein
MKARDDLAYAWQTLTSQPTRSALMILAMAIGVGAVVVLTALGEGARRYVLDQFSSLGTHLLIVIPGRAETSGGTPGVLSGVTPRDLTLDDAAAVARSRQVARVAPLNVGAAQVSNGARGREAVILGSTAEFLHIRHMRLAAGRFLPPGDLAHAASVCVLGARMRSELFGAAPALGAWLRIGDRRFRVIGILAPQGQQMGFNTDETVVIPVAAAQQIFDTPSLFRIMVEARGRDSVERAKIDISEILKVRHEGEEDVTVVTQDAILSTFDRILGALTLAVAGIAAISLSVAGILIMNVMLISVAQRRSEIGLLKAIGATPATIRRLFFTEAALLSLIGSLLGWLLGWLASLGITWLYPTLHATPPVWAVLAALGMALGMGIVFALLPARRAARLDAALALARR